MDISLLAQVEFAEEKYPYPVPRRETGDGSLSPAFFGNDVLSALQRKAIELRA